MYLLFNYICWNIYCPNNIKLKVCLIFYILLYFHNKYFLLSRLFIFRFNFLDLYFYSLFPLFFYLYKIYSHIVNLFSEDIVFSWSEYSFVFQHARRYSLIWTLRWTVWRPSERTALRTYSNMNSTSCKMYTRLPFTCTSWPARRLDSLWMCFVSSSFHSSPSASCFSINVSINSP